MKILKRIGLAILILVALVLIAGLVQSRDYKVEREIMINRAKPETFDYIKMLRNQNSYSKWAMMDPNMKKDFRGTDGTPGFTSAWEGNDDVGKGEQEIKSITEGERMDTEIRFEKPFKSVASSYMITEAAGEKQTKVRWAFAGRMPYPFNALKMVAGYKIGQDLQTGLNNLKANLEKQ